MCISTADLEQTDFNKDTGKVESYKKDATGKRIGAAGQPPQTLKDIESFSPKTAVTPTPATSSTGAATPVPNAPDSYADAPPNLYDEKATGKVWGSKPPIHPTTHQPQCMSLKDTPRLQLSGLSDPALAFSYYMNANNRPFGEAAYLSSTGEVSGSKDIYGASNRSKTSTFFIGNVTTANGAKFNRVVPAPGDQNCPDMFELFDPQTNNAPGSNAAQQALSGDSPPNDPKADSIAAQAAWWRWKAENCYNYYILQRAREPWFTLENPDGGTANKLSRFDPQLTYLGSCQPLARGAAVLKNTIPGTKTPIPGAREIRNTLWEESLDRPPANNANSSAQLEKKTGFAPVLQYVNREDLDEAEYLISDYLERTWHNTFRQGNSTITPPGSTNRYRMKKAAQKYFADSPPFPTIGLPCISLVNDQNEPISDGFNYGVTGFAGGGSPGGGLFGRPLCIPTGPAPTPAPTPPDDQPPHFPVPGAFTYVSPGGAGTYYCPNVEKITEPSHPFSPRFDIGNSSRGYTTDRQYSALTSQMVPFPLSRSPDRIRGYTNWTADGRDIKIGSQYYSMKPHRSDNGKELTGAEMINWQKAHPAVQCAIVPVDILNFRSAAFDSCITQRINTNLNAWIEAGYPFNTAWQPPCATRFFDADGGGCSVKLSIQQCCRIIAKDLVPANFLKMRTAEGLLQKRRDDPTVKKYFADAGGHFPDPAPESGCDSAPGHNQHDACYVTNISNRTFAAGGTWDGLIDYKKAWDANLVLNLGGEAPSDNIEPQEYRFSNYFTKFYVPNDPTDDPAHPYGPSITRNCGSTPPPSSRPLTFNECAAQHHVAQAPCNGYISTIGSISHQIPNTPACAGLTPADVPHTGSVCFHTINDQSSPIDPCCPVLVMQASFTYTCQGQALLARPSDVGKYVGIHMPYMRWWDTGTSAVDSDRQPHGGSFVNTLGGSDVIIGVGREERDKQAGENAMMVNDTMGQPNPDSTRLKDAQKGEAGRIGGWAELKAHQMWTMRQSNQYCIGRYEKLFKPGSAEDFVLSKAGAGYMPVTGGDPQPWPKGWRGFATSTDPKMQFPAAFSTSSLGSGLYLFNIDTTPDTQIPPQTHRGLDNARVGDVVIYTVDGIRHVGYVTAVGKYGYRANANAKETLIPDLSLPSQNKSLDASGKYIVDGKFLHPTMVEVMSHDQGKFLTSTGMSINSGMETRRKIFKYEVTSTEQERICGLRLRALTDTDPGNSHFCRDTLLLDTGKPTKADCLSHSCQPSCVDSDFRECVLPEGIWESAQVYHVNDDVRKCDGTAQSVPPVPSTPFNLLMTYGIGWKNDPVMVPDPNNPLIKHPVAPGGVAGVIYPANTQNVYTNLWAYCVNGGFDPPRHDTEYNGATAASTSSTLICGPAWGDCSAGTKYSEYYPLLRCPVNTNPPTTYGKCWPTYPKVQGQKPDPLREYCLSNIPACFKP